MISSSTVAVIRCPDYLPDLVATSVLVGLSALGEASRLARPGENILLKPNMLAPDPPERAVTTHPTVLQAVAQLVKASGGHALFGDSPGMARQATVARRSGLAQAASVEGVEMVDFSAARTVSHPAGVQNKQFRVAEAALDADGIINLAKLKTHGLTRMTGAVKNLFGCVPGLLKAEFHMRLPDPALFGRMLVDLAVLLRPRLHILDAVMAMEGNGPRGGTPKRVGLLLISTDPVALDATACRIIGLDPKFVPTIAAGETAGLGTARADRIDIVGEPLNRVAVKGFKRVARRPSVLPRRGVLRLARDHIVPKPVIVTSTCTRCGQCVEVCPTRPKSVDWLVGPDGRPDHTRPPKYRYATCIRCYCCQELCPESAIVIKTPWLGHLMPR